MLCNSENKIKQQMTMLAFAGEKTKKTSDIPKTNV